MPHKLPYILLIFTLLGLCFPKNCELQTNQQPIIIEQAKLIASVDHGQKLVIGNLSDPQANYLYVAKLKGTAYQMGVAYGQLFSKQLKDNFNNFYAYYLGQLQTLLIDNHVPKFISKDLTKGFKHLAIGLLDLNVLITKKYTNKRYQQEMEGIAKGSGLTTRDIERVNIVPEIIKAACTVVGLWGKATEEGNTLHMRSLDWDSGNPISKYPIAIVYHPSEKGAHKHVNLAWIGFVGVLTGASEHLSIGQKVWLPGKHSVKTTRYGTPWTLVLRNVLYDAQNLTQALEILSSAHRTCTIHLGLASKVDHSFRMILYSEQLLVNYDDKNYTNYNENYHPKRQGMAFWDKGVQPNSDPCVGKLLAHKDYYGHWEAESLWRTVGMTHETGDTQLVVFDLEQEYAIISYSHTELDDKNKTVVTQAWKRRPFYLSLEEFWRDF